MLALGRRPSWNLCELKAALRRRTTGGEGGGEVQEGEEGSGDDDPGLPRSPPTSPTTLDVLNHGLKSVSRATQSTCSDGSLLSMGSSELEEDSAVSLHSSKHSLLGDGRLLQVVVDHEPVVGEAPGLSHTAARHKMAVRPRRTHASTRPRRPLQVTTSSLLPTTLEVNEESSVPRGTHTRHQSAGEAFTPSASTVPNIYPGTSPNIYPGTSPNVYPGTSPNMQTGIFPSTYTGVNPNPGINSIIYPGANQKIYSSTSTGPPPQTSYEYLVAQHEQTSTHVSQSVSYTAASMFDPLNYHPDPHHLQSPAAPQPSAPLPIPGHGAIVTQPSFTVRDQKPTQSVNEHDGAGSSEGHQEPLLSRLFGSSRSGRNRSRADADDGRDPSTSPLRRDVKLPRAKGGILSRSNSRGRQQLLQQQDEQLRLLQEQEEKQRRAQQEQQQEYIRQQHLHDQHQLELQHQQLLQAKIKGRSVESRWMEDRSEHEGRSSSVEGRIEGHELENKNLIERKHPVNVQISSYQERGIYSQIRNEVNVKKAKSFREVGKPVIVVKRESSRRSWFGRELSSDYTEHGASRLSASYDSLDDKVVHITNKPDTPSQSVASLVDKEPRKSGPTKVEISPALSSTLSSTDSLTTTEIPGIYIRPLSQYKKHPVETEEIIEHQSYFCTKQTQFSKYNESVGDNSSGPLSLDSSITLIPRDDENIRKTSSSDHVSSNVQLKKSSTESLTKATSKISPLSSYECDYDDSVADQKRISLGESSATDIQISTDYPSKFPSYMPSGPPSVLRSMSLRDTGTPCGILSRRASSADELEAEALPAARGRYRRRDSAMADYTSQDMQQTTALPEFMRIQLHKVENKPQRVVYDAEEDSSSVVSSRHHSVDEHPFDNIVTESVDTCNLRTESEEKLETDLPDKHRPIFAQKIRRESTVSQSSLVSCPVEPADDIVLRRPMRREKSLIIDPTQIPKREEQPELFKVFARRSFKVRDCFTTADEEEDQMRKIDDPAELVASLSSQMSGVTKINPIYSTPTPPLTPIISSSFNNKFSVGSPTIAFKPPANISKDTQSTIGSDPSSGVQAGPATCEEQTASESAKVKESVSKVVIVSKLVNSTAVYKASQVSKNETASNLSSNTSCSTSGNPPCSTSGNTSCSTSGKVSIRPMSSTREANSFTTATSISNTSNSSSAGNMTSVILNRASSVSNEHTANIKSSTSASHTVTTISQLSSPSVSETVTGSSPGITSVVWPPKNTARSAIVKSSPFTAQVKPEQLNYINSKKNVEIIENEQVTPAEVNDEVSSTADSTSTEESMMSQVQSVRKKFMIATTTKPSISTSTTVPVVVEARNTIPAFTVTVRSTPTAPTVRHSSFHAASRSHSSATSSPLPSVAASSPATTNHHRHSIGGVYVPHPRQQVPSSSFPSPPTLKRTDSHASSGAQPLVNLCQRSHSLKQEEESTHSVLQHSSIIQNALRKQSLQPADVVTSSPVTSVGGTLSSSPVPTESSESAVSGEDWRALVRQRREDRLKMSKSVESLDDTTDGRSGSSSRGSKVLEMASNFQKMQAA